MVMLQYILNVSAIWLLSIAVFDLFLRRDTYHGFNRAYLLLTLLAGLVIPAVNFHVDEITISRSFAPVVQRVTGIGQSMDATVANSDSAVHINWFLLVYSCGTLIAFFLLLKELMDISRLYKHGARSRDGVWVIIETGKDHSPFSAFRYVFISSRKSYDEEELRVILSHEEQHGHLLHFIDLFFVQLLKIVFWFNPLIYIYLNRLAAVHEYQADSSVAMKPVAYGKFLVEQSMLSSAPAISHSFNHSSIQKRIFMLTKTSSSRAAVKKVLLFPVLLLALLCFSKNAFSDGKRVRNGNTVTYRGNRFEFKSMATDTVMVQDPVTGDMIMKILAHEPTPVSMNGKKIYTEQEIKKYPETGDYANVKARVNVSILKEYLLTHMTDEIAALPDGPYWLYVSNVVIGDDGKIAYFDYAGISTKGPWPGMEVNKAILSATTKDRFARKVFKLIDDAPAHDAATLQGKNVASLMDDMEFGNPFYVKNGKLDAL